MKRHERVKMIVLTALFAAVTAILAQIEIPLPYVPISGQTLAVGITATILGSWYGALSMILYMALGTVGLPVFAGMSSGIHVLVGPTGGYIIGFIFAAFIIGFILERARFNYFWAIIANVVGMVVTLVFGTVQLKYAMALSWGQAVTAGVYPFILVGLIKSVLAAWIGILVHRRLVTARLLFERKSKAA
ncbi:biotin transporter BioY [Camelliibacillus cellulosilyticus]|uniref:Biotin transporter n=1 Tax=Camelliibacillus cellulosilyticus TaxID=2174486 RepID=A0ABV9GHN6_9BACL